MSRRFGRAGTLGEGSFGRVEQVVDVETGQLFAAKVFLGDGSGFPSTETLVELQFLHSIGTHPNIVDLETVFFDLDGLPGIPVAVLGLCQRDLEKSLTWLTGPQRRQVLLGLWSGLAYLHSPNFALLHRDIKAGNVLLNFENQKVEAKLCDFSFGAWFPKNGENTLRLRAPAEGPLGTTGYIAPELFEDLPFTPAADVWAAAVVSLEVIQGHVFECARDKAAFRQLFAVRDRLGQTNLWSQLLRKLLQEDPEGRPSAADVVQEITGSPFVSETTPRDPEAPLQKGLAHWRRELTIQQKQQIGKAFAVLEAPPVAEAYMGLLMLRFPTASTLALLMLTTQILMGDPPFEFSMLTYLANIVQCPIPTPDQIHTVLSSCQGDLLGLGVLK